MRFRTGRKLGRTLYIQHREHPHYSDTFIGIMDSRALGELVCIALNRLSDLDPGIVETVARQVARGNMVRDGDHPPDQQDQRSVDPDDTCGAVMPMDDQH